MPKKYDGRELAEFREFVQGLFFRELNKYKVVELSADETGDRVRMTARGKILYHRAQQLWKKSLGPFYGRQISGHHRSIDYRRYDEVEESVVDKLRAEFPEYDREFLSFYFSWIQVVTGLSKKQKLAETDLRRKNDWIYINSRKPPRLKSHTK